MELLSPEKDFQIDYVDTPEALSEFCQRIDQAEWIVLDTEFLREKTYYPQLCLIQIAIPGFIACIDPLVLDDLGDLFAILNNNAVTKVIHACSQDLEVLLPLGGKVLAPIFDTQIAAPLLGLPEQTGYASLVEALLGVKLEKGHARTDWSVRPLSKKQVEYAMDDVRYLCELYPIMLEKLSSQGRLTWLEDDFRRYESPDRYQNDPAQAWLRVRGNDRLSAKQARVLQALAQWREQLAQSENRPRAWMLRDNVLLDIARICPEDRKELANIRQIPEHVVAKQGDELIQLITDAIESRLQLTVPTKNRRAKASQKQEALAEVLQAQLVLLAEKNAINPATLATKKQLLGLVMGERDIPVLTGWRKEMAGKELLALIEGKRIISVKNNELVFSDIQ